MENPKVANATKYVDVGTANAKPSFALACGLQTTASGVIIALKIAGVYTPVKESERPCISYPIQDNTRFDIPWYDH